MTKITFSQNNLNEFEGYSPYFNRKMIKLF